jgi:purine nucleosidase
MTPRPIIIDTDPGLDDAIAILLAFASPELDVLGLTAVAGNVELSLTAANARRICELAGRIDTKVFAGCSRPILRSYASAATVHGETGLNGAGLPPPQMPLQRGHAVDWIVEAVMTHPESSITVCALGPLTNLALAIVKEPRVASRVREIVIMGGAGPSGGNVTASAEFNIHADPHAAQVVFESGARLALVPLDLTRQVRTNDVRLQRIRAIDSAVSRAVTGMIEFYNVGEGAAEGASSGPLHDPCVIAYLLRPDLFVAEAAQVEVETQSLRTMGMTVIDTRLSDGRAANCRVLVKADADGFFELLIERLAALSASAGTP